MRHTPSRPLSLVLAGLLSLTVAACDRSPAPDAPAAAAAGDRHTVTLAPVADLKPVVARVTSRDLAEARARIGGTLVRLDVREGDAVRRGQVIGLVRDDRLDLQTRALAAQVTAAAAEAERAESELARVRRLAEQGVYAPARLEQAEAAARAAVAARAAASASQAAGAEASAQGAIVAPAAGRVVRADTPAGSVVTPGQSIATITAGPLVLRLELPEAQAEAVRPGAAVRIDARDLPGAATAGMVTQLYPAVSGGRVTADVAVEGLTDALIDRRVRVEVAVGQRQALVIPARLVSTRHGVDFVRVAGADGRVSDVAVQLAPGPSPDLREVLSGVRAGDQLLAPAAGR